jgi:putative ABC transport system ATP-binding protein
MSDAADRDRVVISARGLVKRYEAGRVIALDRLDLDVQRGAFVAVCGPSGCGKSTLLNMIAGIDRPDAGTLTVADRPLATLTPAELDRYRATTIGLVFQLHNLLPNLTALENVQVPMVAAGVPRTERAGLARALLERVGLAARADARPPVLSGGERQRIAIARALANTPAVLLADEPTGALDSQNGARLLALLTDIQRELGTTLVIVTHDAELAGRAERVLHMRDGRIVGDTR